MGQTVLNMNLMKTFKIVHGHAVYEVTEKMWNLICLNIIGKKDKYVVVMELLAKYPDEHKYIEQVHFVS